MLAKTRKKQNFKKIKAPYTLNGQLIVRLSMS